MNNNPFYKNPFGIFLDRRVDLICDENVPDYVQQSCGAELGGIPFVGFIDSSIVINEDDFSATLENAAWWTGNIAVSPSNRFIVLKTRGSKPKGTPVEEEGYGFASVQNNGDDKELNFRALGVHDNQPFWAGVNLKTDWQIIYGTAGKNQAGDYRAFYAKNVTVYADEVIEESIKSRIYYDVNAKWSTIGIPSKPFYFPASVIATLSA